MPLPRIPEFQRDVVSPKFYDSLGETAVGFGYVFSSRRQLKIDVQKHILFNHGKRGFGSHPLFLAFGSLYPREARLICGIRRGRHFGGSILYRVIAGLEGALMVDRAIPHLDALGIPAISNHDAVLVPLSEVERVAGILRDISRQLFAFELRVGHKEV